MIYDQRARLYLHMFVANALPAVRTVALGPESWTDKD